MYRWVDNLFLNGVVFYSLLIAINGDVFCDLILEDLWNVLGLVLNSIIISISTFTGDVLDNFLILILNIGLLIRDILNS